MENNSYRLLSFAVENFRSIKDEQRLTFGDNNVVAIYGANASGKTNIAKALGFVSWFIQNSANANITGLPHNPFKLNTETRNQPSIFTIEFGDKEDRLSYKFSFNSDAIIGEELIDLSSTRPKIIFARSGDGLGPNASKYGFGKQLFESTRSNSLAITKAQENNNPYAQKVFSMIQAIRVVTVGDGQLKGWSSDIVKNNPEIKERAADYLRQADLWIRGVNVEEQAMPEDLIKALPFNDEEKNRIRSNKLNSVKTRHAIRDNDGNITGEEWFDMGSEESAGTNNFFDMIVPIIAALDNNLLLYIDEFGSSLHPDLSELIINIFKQNKVSSAQLIVNTHDTNLMNEDLLSPPEIYLIQKTYAEDSILGLLKDSPQYRSTDSKKLEKRYRLGLYGGVPQTKKLGNKNS